MKTLYEKIEEDVIRWRKQGYPCEQYPLIQSILAYQCCGDGENNNTRRYLHAAQLQALETYWFLRLVKKTPRFMDLHRIYYQNEKEIVEALSGKEQSDLFTPEEQLEKLLADEKKTIFESSRLDYPSYIFALTMGTGKTVLIGAIVSTEFVMSMRYEQNKTDGIFMKNALVFAPGKTIMPSLMELGDMDYKNILPPYHCKKFIVNLKIHHTTSKNNSINTQPESSYNLVITNTEKIIVRKNNKKYSRKKEEYLIENERFRNLAQLPSLGIFSDEAHHTYGQKAFDDIKRVRETINRLHKERCFSKEEGRNSSKGGIVCVVNTTGTPYYKKQLLSDVVIWYGLAEAIREGVLKSLTIKKYSIKKETLKKTAQTIMLNFFKTYGKIKLHTGQKAKIAFYFNSQEDLDKVKGTIEKTAVDCNESVTCVLTNTQKSSDKDIKEFERLHYPQSDKRVILLVGKGREGWNCPSLFACALITKQTSGNNHVLQSSARCLRGVREDKLKSLPARIYLDTANVEILKNELQQTFGKDMSLSRLTGEIYEKEPLSVEIRDPDDLPCLKIDREIEIWERQEQKKKALRFQPPDIEAIQPYLKEQEMNLAIDDDFKSLVEGAMRRLPIEEVVSLQRAATDIALPLHLNGLEVLKALQKIYNKGPVAKHHIEILRKQAEEILGHWKKKKMVVTRSIKLIRTKDEQGEPLFEEKQDGSLHHTFWFSKSRFEEMKRDKLFVCLQDGKDKRFLNMQDKKGVSFHYNPYNLSNKSERIIFNDILKQLNFTPNEVDGFYFTGSLTDHRKTDMWFEYKGKDNRFHKYFPDFVLYKKSGEWMILEIKGERDRGNPTVDLKTEAMKRIEELKKKKICYHILYYPPADNTSNASKENQENQDSWDNVKKWIAGGNAS